MAFKKENKKRYSYIRKAYSKNGWISFAIGLLVIILSFASIAISVYQGGRASMLSSSLGFSAIVFSIMGLWFTRLGLMENDKNMLFAKIGGIASFIVVVFWIIIML
ncbi:MAG: DUF6142 family protein [Eubacteriales bacterium]|nr:DUF6142 family protein [Eubacteriales bacterium]